MAAFPLTAQEHPSLERAETLAREGRTEEARTELAAWWTQSLPSADRGERQRALWLRGRLTVDPRQAALDYQRLVIEYPGGMFSDQALFRLAQGAWVSGDPEGARRFVRRLVREYPESPARRQAEAWIRDAGPPLLTLPPAEVSPDTAAGLAAAAVTDTATRPPAPAARPTAAPDTGGRIAPRTDTVAPTGVNAGRYAVQVGAFANESLARGLLRTLRAEGFDARMVRVEGGRLIRVRVGRFGAEQAAGAILRSIKEKEHPAVLVRDADREIPVGQR